MKKILFASTALIATAGVAAAEVEFGGYGRFGLVYNDAATGTAKETRIEQRMRLNITGIAETDAGVKLEARFRLQSDETSVGGATAAGPGAAVFSASYGGMRLDVGNISDVVDSGDVVDVYGYGIGLTALIETQNQFVGIDANGIGNSDIDQTGVKVRYAVGDFTVSASYTEENEAVAADAYYQLGARYDFGTFGVGAIYGERDDAASTSYWVLGADGSVGAVAYNVLVADSDGLDDVTYAASVSYDVSSATSIRALVAAGGMDNADTAYGLGFRHGLGGGVTLAGGVAENAAGATLADLGVVFNF